MLKEPRQVRPLLIRYLIISLAAISMLTGCSTRSDKTPIADSPVSAYSKQQASASAAPEMGVEMSGIPSEPTPKEPPSIEANWEEPPDIMDYSGPYWGLRNAFPLPDFQEITISEELGHTLEEFFGENPEISEETLASALWLKPCVLLMDITGDCQPEILIQRFTNYGAADQNGGLVSVYDLATAQHMGDLWLNDSWCENMGWYEGLDKDGMSFLVIDNIFFRTADETGFGTELFNYSYILWEISCDGGQLNKSPLWLLMSTIWNDPENMVTEYSLLDPSYELAVGFSKDPYSWYETVKSMASEGCDPVIRDMILQLQPVKTIYQKYAYMDREGLHLLADRQ